MMLGLLSAALAQFGPSQQKPKGPWENKALAADERARLVVKEMTLDEKVQMVHGLGWMAMFMKPATGPGVRAISAGGFVPGVERLGIPDLQMTDSVLGVSGAGVGGRYATPLPSGEAMAAAWDPALSREIGSLLGAEVRGMGFNMSLGSGINMIREPRGGRTFEYKGEDPLLAATLASAELKAEKELGLITDLKHYAVNDQDEGRMVVNSVISKRAMRESDLLAFEIALRDSGADAVMCSYNKINGVYGCENEYTLGVLKKDFGFKGFVVSDWGATHSTANAVMAGLDMEMPNLGFLGAPLKKAVESGEVPVARLDDMVLRIVRAMFDSGIVDNPPHAQSPDVVRGFQVAQKTAERGTVLLKNASALLPLKADAIRSIAVIGGHADAGVISGGGSSQVSPPGGNAVECAVVRERADFLPRSAARGHPRTCQGRQDSLQRGYGPGRRGCGCARGRCGHCLCRPAFAGGLRPDQPGSAGQAGCVDRGRHGGQSAHHRGSGNQWRGADAVDRSGRRGAGGMVPGHLRQRGYRQHSFRRG
jgi:beta-glucosidase